MKKILILIILLFFPFNSYAKTIVDKGVVCKNTKQNLSQFHLTPIIGLWFDKNNKVSLFQRVHNATLKKNVWSDMLKGTYKEEDFIISIIVTFQNYFYTGKWILDRTSTRLTHDNFEFKCNLVFANKNQFLKSLDNSLVLYRQNKKNEKFRIQNEYNVKLNKRVF